MNLREEIASYVHQAIDGTFHYKGKESAQNRHNWEQITTDKIIQAVVLGLPPPIDRFSKYEGFDGEGLSVSLHEQDSEALNYLCQFADDTGYNRYHLDMVAFFAGLYNAKGVQSDYEHQEPKPR